MKLTRPPQKRPRVFRAFFILSVTFVTIFTSIYYTTLSPARAEPSTSLPQPSGEFYYSDGAGILSESTRQAILEKNQELAAQSAQLVVITADSFPVSGYAQRVEYLRQIMDAWQVGGAEGRGLLLAVSTSDQDYITLAGESLQARFTTEFLKALLDASMEPDFQAGSYDAAVLSFVNEASAQILASQADQPRSITTRRENSGLPVWAYVLIGVGCAAAVTALVLFFLSSRGRPSRRAVHRHNPLITPPRTNVVRLENHTPIVIKSPDRVNGIYRGRNSSSHTRRL